VQYTYSISHSQVTYSLITKKIGQDFLIFNRLFLFISNIISTLQREVAIVAIQIKTRLRVLDLDLKHKIAQVELIQPEGKLEELNLRLGHATALDVTAATSSMASLPDEIAPVSPSPTLSSPLKKSLQESKNDKMPSSSQSKTFSENETTMFETEDEEYDGSDEAQSTTHSKRPRHATRDIEVDDVSSDTSSEANDNPTSTSGDNDRPVSPFPALPALWESIQLPPQREEGSESSVSGISGEGESEISDTEPEDDLFYFGKY
jgi:hypothetical protein